MASMSWHNYGYGICTDKLEANFDLERFKNAIKTVKPVKDNVYRWLVKKFGKETNAEAILDKMNIKELSDFYCARFDGMDECLTSAFLYDCLSKDSRIPAMTCKDYDSERYYVIMPPCYPWEVMKNETIQAITSENAIKAVFQKYVSLISDLQVDDLDCGFQEIKGYI